MKLSAHLDRAARGRRRSTLILLAALISACGSSGSAPAPTAPSTTSSPSATPAPTATPASPGSGGSLPASCRTLPPATGTAAGCHQEASDFLRAVTDAVAAAQFATVTDPDTKEVYSLIQDGVIQSPNAYVKSIVDILDRQGLCAAYDGEEINVRNSSGYNEQFDIVTSSGGSWIKYMSTCTPAVPIPQIPAPPVQDPECKLSPSASSFCTRTGAVYDGDVYAALDELIAADRQLATSQIFDFSSRAPGTSDGWMVKNTALYFSEMRKKLRTRGYCSVYSGDDELLIKKGTNRFSEHWDLLKSEGFSLRLLATTCRDAGF